MKTCLKPYLLLSFGFRQFKLLSYKTFFFSVTCSAPTTIANGRVDYYIPLDGSTGSYRPGSPVNGQVPDNTLAYVFCDEGYITSHVHHVACILDGDWNAPVPTCTGNQIKIILKSTDEDSFLSHATVQSKDLIERLEVSTGILCCTPL